MPLNKFGFTRWNFQYDIGSDTTLDPIADHKLLRRIAGRKNLFMNPLLTSGYLKGKRVLDLGSNSGYWSYITLAEGGASFVQGIEASPELVEQANFVFEKKGMIPGSYDFRLDDAYSYLRETEDRFDVVLCLGFFYHINDPLALLQLMRRVCRGFTVIDTIVHKSDEALISVRPVQRKSVIDEANITLELVSSPKAIHWLAEEAGYVATRDLTDDYEKISSMWDYIGAFRSAHVCSVSDKIETIWPTALNPGYMTTSEDLEKYGYFPEMHRKGGRS